MQPDHDPASLEGLHDIVEPVPVSLWWPLAPGWWVALALLVVLLAALSWRGLRAYRRNAYRRCALRELSELEQLDALPVLLKRVALVAIAVGAAASSGRDAIDEGTLQAVAEATGGDFFRASSREQLETIYQRIDELEAREAEVVTHRPTSELFHWPLGAALLLTLGFHLALAIRSTVTSSVRAQSARSAT